VHRVRSELSDERIHVVQWHAETTRYIAEALGLGYVPPMTLLETWRRAEVLLGEIDIRGHEAGQRATNAAR
jgi:hypothetical protein